MSSAAPNTMSSAFSRSLRWAGYTLGFAVGGFFDGILLHQVLQWHHLLAGLEGGRFDDLRFQIMADGLFHALMYVIGAIGLWLLWRARREFALPRADRLLVANALIGFGAWHIVDSIASHWVLGIHRIRMDSDAPLLWDLIWFVGFGVAPAILGWMLRPGGGANARAARAPAGLVLLTLLGGVGAGLPPADAEEAPVVVVFLPGVTASQALEAMQSVEGRLVWSDPHDHVWAIDVPSGVSTAGLYARGAMAVSGSLAPLGCLNWFRS